MSLGQNCVVEINGDVFICTTWAPGYILTTVRFTSKHGERWETSLFLSVNISDDLQIK